MKKKRAAPVKGRVAVEILQNGEVLTHLTVPLKGTRVFTLKRLLKNCFITSFPLPISTEIFAIQRSSVHLKVDSTWRGFFSQKGTLHHLNSLKHELAEYPLALKDYASLQKNDIRILIKTYAAKTAKTVPLNKDYRGSIFSLMLGGPRERLGLALGLVCALILFGGFVGGLTVRPDDRPRVLKDLTKEYTLAFIHPDHLKTLPEAIQGNLRRDKSVSSTIEYYDALASMFLGYGPINHSLLFPSSISYFDAINGDAQTRIKIVGESQGEAAEKAIKAKITATLTIPAVHGEGFATKMARLEQRLATYHESLDVALQSRRIVTKEFKNDAGYDYTEYKNLKLSQEAREALSKINVFGILTDEEAMYKEMLDLSQTAASLQKQIRLNREPVKTITPQSVTYIGIPAGFDLVNAYGDLNWHSLSKKLNLAEGSLYGTQRKVREPLVGEIEPHLIENVISRRKFELQLCFELALRRNRELAGTMEWQWRLDSRGTISDIKLISSSIKDHKMHRCVQQKLSRWKFPRPRRGSVEITYPFHFKPAKG